MNLHTQRAFALVEALRPRQWLKNVLVTAAPLAAGALLQWSAVLACALAFIAFCAAASGVYLINDSLDVPADREHPKKRNRPIASGRVSVPVALTLAVILLLGALALAFFLVTPAFALVIAVYEAIQIGYCFWLKHLVVIDIVVVASGFLLRAIGGAAAVDVAASQWFLLVAAFGSLFMVAGKRYAEKLHHDDTGAATRASLVRYTASYLRFVWTTAAGLTLITYALWAFSLDDVTTNFLPALTVIPFSLAILRYAYDVDRGTAGAPEDTVLGDPTLLVTGAVWLGLFAYFVTVR